MKDYRYLVCVDGADNHNKYYEATLNDDNTIDVTYGRVGKSATTHHYGAYEKDFYDLIYSKERKGYEDITDSHTQGQQKTSADFKEMEDKEAEDFLKHFLDVCRQNVARNYSNPNAITNAQVLEAKSYLTQIEAIDKKEWQNDPNYCVRIVNTLLQKEYAVAPRIMDKVSNYLLPYPFNGAVDDAIKRLNTILDKEKDLLDSLKVVTQTKNVNPDKTIAQDAGVGIRQASYAEEDMLKELMNVSRDKSESLTKVFAIQNDETKKRYEDCKRDLKIKDKDCRLLFHGSGQENWYSIMGQGLSLNPNAKITGKGLGNGIYFADDVCKALNYSSDDTKYIGVYEVAVGKRQRETSYGQYSLSYLQGKNKDTIFLDASKGANHSGLNEYCIYREEQANLKYIIQCDRERHKDVRFSMHFSLPFKELVDEGDKLTATAELSDYAKDELWKIANIKDPKTDTVMGDFVAEYDLKKQEFTLYNCIDDKGELVKDKIELTDDEKERLFRDFKKSFFESERNFKEYAESDPMKRFAFFADGQTFDKDEYEK